jgi:oligopeptide/dipeptide ABC transporter ATP-binding protein
MNSAVSAAAPLLRVRDLTVTYEQAGGSRTLALDRASFDLRATETLGIFGESGSGKSTLAAALLRLLPAHARCEGTVTFRNREILGAPRRELREIRGRGISLIPQEPALTLNPVISVGDQIAEVLRAHLEIAAATRRARTRELLEEVGFEKPDDIYHAYPHQLSGGQRQRIAIAQAMSCRPALLIADEATSKLDPVLQAEILALMRAMGQRHGTAFLLISHNPAVIAGFATRVAVMYAGRIIETGTTHDVFRRHLHPYTQALVNLSSRRLAGPGARRRFSSIDGEAPDATSLAPGCRFAPRCPEKMPACTERNPAQTTQGTSHHVRCFKYEA